MKFKVYCDSGGFNKNLLYLEKSGYIELLYYPYETINKKVQKITLPSAMTWDDMIRPWNEEFYSWKDYIGSEKFNEIIKVLNLNNRKDALHLDSAYKSKCHFFVTSDKNHIYSNRDDLYKLLSVKICLHTDLNQIIEAIKTSER